MKTIESSKRIGSSIRLSSLDVFGDEILSSGGPDVARDFIPVARSAPLWLSAALLGSGSGFHGPRY
jgi:hypothetical protein